MGLSSIIESLRCCSVGRTMVYPSRQRIHSSRYGLAVRYNQGSSQGLGAMSERETGVWEIEDRAH